MRGHIENKIAQFEKLLYGLPNKHNMYHKNIYRKTSVQSCLLRVVFNVFCLICFSE